MQKGRFFDSIWCQTFRLMQDAAGLDDDAAAARLGTTNFVVKRSRLGIDLPELMHLQVLADAADRPLCLMSGDFVSIGQKIGAAGVFQTYDHHTKMHRDHPTIAHALAHVAVCFGVSDLSVEMTDPRARKGAN